MRRIPSERSLALVLLLSLATCGIYYLYWMYATAQETDEFLGEPASIPPIVHVLLYIFTGTLWGFAFDILTAQKVARMQQRVGMPSTDNTILYLVFDLLGAGPYYGLGIVTTLMEQNSLNEIYRVAGSRFVPAGSGRPLP